MNNSKLDPVLVVSYRQEILEHNRDIRNTTRLVVILMFVCWSSANYLRINWPLYPIFALTVGFVGAWLQHEHFVHRLGGFLKNHGDPWENALERKRKVWLTPVTDLVAIAPILFFLGSAIRALLS